MKSRNGLIVAGTALLALTIGAVLIAHVIKQRREFEREALRIASEQLSKSFAVGMADVDINGPHLDCLAKLDGDVTTVTITISNRATTLYKEVIFQGFTLGKVEPREKATLPVKIAELAPGVSHKFEFHYDGLKWIEDDLDVNRADLSWAERLLDFSSSWVTSVNPKSLPSAPGVSISATDFKGSSSHTGVRIPLDEADARALKARHDADWKAKVATKGSQTVPPPSKS
jgi:hypothetical protein